MAENPININQLRTACDHFITAEYPYYEELREAFRLLKHTGCRIQEIFDISRWSIVSGYMVKFSPQKHNNDRLTTLSSEFNSFLSAIQNQHAPFLGRTYSQLQNLFDRINPYGKLFSGEKEITNYIYRYLYVRELLDAGLTIQQIADLMGYHSTTAVSNYLNADLDSTIKIPDTPTDPLPEGHIDILISPFYFNGVGNWFHIPHPLAGELFSVNIHVTPENTSVGYAFSYYWYDKFERTISLNAQLYGSMLRVNFHYNSRRGLQLITANIDLPATTESNMTYVVNSATVGSSGGNYRDITIKAYVNGILHLSNSKLNTIVPPLWEEFLNLGARIRFGTTVEFPYKGYVKNFCVWQRELNDTEIYNSFHL